MTIHMNLGESSYDIIVERGSLNSVSESIDLNRKVLIVTDSGVPKQYAQTVASKAKDARIETIPQGEASKNFDMYRHLLKILVEEGFTRTDCVVAVGGGVTGDLSGFVAASYMRGIDFYNIPTTVLSQIDSSIGGKVAIDFEGFKNIVGAFYQPKKVIIDPDVLKTLPKRQIANGLAEAVKMALTSDEELFELFEKANPEDCIDEIIVRSLNIKKYVVEQDEKEAGLRKILNFGHTIGHGIESEQGGRLYHGECVALGMIPMCGPKVRKRLIRVLEKTGLPSTVNVCREKVFDALKHDKKFKGDKVTVIKVNEVGSFVMEEVYEEDVLRLLDEIDREK